MSVKDKDHHDGFGNTFELSADYLKSLRTCVGCKGGFTIAEGQVLNAMNEGAKTPTQVFLCNECFKQVSPNTQMSMSVGPPQMLDQPNLDGLTRICQAYIDDLTNKGWADEDSPQYVFEEAMTALFGPDVFTWINKRQG